jgi:hypothetical protein
MNIVITSHPREDYLLIKSKGQVNNKEELIQQSEMIYEEITRHGATRIILDELEMKFPTTLFSYYDLVNYYTNEMPKSIRSLKIAVVISEEYREVSSFWETLCVNQGMQYFAFTSFKEAHEWLLNETYAH